MGYLWSFKAVKTKYTAPGDEKWTTAKAETCKKANTLNKESDSTDSDAHWLATWRLMQQTSYRFDKSSE